MSRREGIDRRLFLRASAAGGGSLLLGFNLFGCKDKSSSPEPSSSGGGPGGAPEPEVTTPGELSAQEPVAAGAGADINAWIRIDPDDRVTLFVPESEMGQGVLTAVAMILADELDAPWENVTAVHAPADQDKYGRQGTGGSSSIRRGWEGLRNAGAAAREMLVAAAAAQWKVDADKCKAELGAVSHGENRASYGALAAAAAELDPPEKPRLKKPAEFRYIGKPIPRLDTPAKVDGSAVYGIDVRVPGMLTASVEHCPIFGGKLGQVDDAAARTVAGVRDVLQIPSGVAVVADHYWAARKGREALKITWDDGGNGALSSGEITATCADAADEGVPALEEGDAAKVLAGAKKKIDAVYEVPYLAHAPMEPLNATAKVTADACEVWVSTQSPSGVVETAAEITGLAPENITVHTAMLGGGFGRRSQNDFVADAVDLAKSTGKPVKVVWSREDDIRGGFYRPMAYNQLSAAVGADGMPIAWSHRIASPSILRSLGGLEDGIDRTSVEGAANLPYKIRHRFVSYADVEVPVTLWFWRSVGSSQNAYVTEAFLDEVAALGGKDPFELRRKLLAGKPRHRKVLEVAADKAGWGTKTPEGVARGIAVHESFGSFVAQVAEVSIEQGRPRVHKIVCAVDCGQVVNPNTIEAQMESGIAYGLSAALHGAVTIENGRAVQSNFHDYPALRMTEMPRVETHIVASGEPHGGVGEPGLPPAAPAVVNALFALTGEPIRKLPIGSIA